MGLIRKLVQGKDQRCRNDYMLLLTVNRFVLKADPVVATVTN